MNNFWIILWHTYITKLKTKSFIVTTIITALLIVVLANMNNIIGYFSDDDKNQIAVINETEATFPLEEQLAALNENMEIEYFNGTVEEAENKVVEGEYEGLLILTLGEDNLPAGEYKSSSIADSTVAASLQNVLQQIKTDMAAEQLNLSQEQLAELYAPVEFNSTALAENAKTEEELSQARGLVYVLLFLIYFAVIMYASMIANEVATEKSSRVMEILISSVPPIRQMFAKILGIGLLSFTQMVVIGLVGYASLKRNLSSMEGGWFEAFGFSDLSMSTVLYAGIFFLLGYFLYATLAAFLGSLVSRIEDVQQMIMPMTMLIVAGFLIAMFGLGQPDSTFVTITSYIPFFTPMLMFLRVGMLSLPIWEPILGITILIGTTVILAIFGARVYRGGVLMYGKSSSYKDVKKALQLSKKEDSAE
ncbi:ABC-2 type transport system permease protein [Cytobacillus horneckiae]|uniref:ABC transporter permease n=1 Tax=Cytobacillus horneckiae TaxID=549687 RepID=A0A2N0ZF15_9BACI|nr:ABC transporter permease [Cytobacillus horneckiae]MBN6887661.1 ABC transporter permease [Cytobacillus horneckiae]MCM3178718.1 ABC transporter permease [Cytobacillus horneckiae]MEC1158194.1 ABC transporter permease [Cytobacillus horneckiae]MED2940162.1 ABC transporter permease [Cytobacillus horneckiae]PKG28096.1 ABC transporter permease [Cytobacillus horneckiae]